MTKHFLSILFLLFLSAIGYAERGQSKLDELESAVRIESSRLEHLQDSLKKARSGIAVLSRQIADLREKERNTGEELKKVIAARDRQAEKLRDLQQTYTAVSLKSQERLRALYMQSRQAIPVTTSKNQNKAAYYSGMVREYDLRLLETLMRTGQKIAASQKALETLISNSDRLASELKEQRQALSKKLDSQNKAVKELEKTKQQLAASVTKLRAQALRLETIVAGMIDEPRQEFYKQKASGEDVGNSRQSSSADFDGKGLAALKDSLIKPLKDGTLKKRFGKHTVAGFKEMVFNKGLEFSAEAGADVYAVAPAVVLYSGKMPAFGNFVILNHGKRSYTLYGRLSDILVKPKDRLNAGDLIARLLDANGEDTESAALYFEVRQDGKPVDPLQYFGKMFD